MATGASQQTIQGRELLIQVARRLFLERGYAQVSIQQIAEEASMTKGAPYYHFANKQDLFIHVCLDILAEFKWRLETGLSGEGSFQDRIERATVDIVRAMSGDFSQWYSDLVKLDDKQAFGAAVELAHGANEMEHIILPVFSDASEKGEITRVSPEVAVRSYFLLLKATIDDCGQFPKRFPGRELDIESRVHELVDIYFHGVA